MIFRRRLTQLERKVADMAADLTNLQSAVATLTTDVSAAVAEIQNGSKPSQTEVDAVTSQVEALSAQLSSVLTPPATP